MDNLNEMLLETNIYNESIKARQYSFSDREKEIIMYIEQGHTLAVIAGKMGIAEVTLKKKLSKIYSALKIKNRYELVEFIHTKYMP